MDEIKNYDLLKDKEKSLSEQSVSGSQQGLSNLDAKKEAGENSAKEAENNDVEKMDQSQRDSLTGLYKRDVFLSRLEDSIAANEKVSVFILT